MTAPDVQAKRASWKEQIGGIDPEHLVYLDECGVNIDLTRLYGRSIGKARVVDHTPLNTPRMTTVLSSIRTDGSHVTTTYTGGTTGERFTDYLRDKLIPELKSGDVVVMDNLRSHHVQGVKEAFDAAGIQFLYLPPYSPDLNPIEKMWSKMKAILRKWKERSAERLSASVADALKFVSTTDCLHWFEACSLSWHF